MIRLYPRRKYRQEAIFSYRKMEATLLSRVPKKCKDKVDRTGTVCVSQLHTAHVERYKKHLVTLVTMKSTNVAMHPS